MFDTAVFLGPSLDVVSAQSILKAMYLPPIRRGDLSQLSSDIKTVGIIDGEFYQSLAVSPKEVLQLLNRGTKVYGSSSMGALRAAETHMYGMVGIGAIFEMYRDGMIDADDEVALTYDPDTYSSSSDSLINVRFALKESVRKHLISESTAEELIREMRALYFPFRSYRLLVQMCPKLKGFVEEHCPNQKRDDAKLLLQTIAQEGGISLGAIDGGSSALTDPRTDPRGALDFDPSGCSSISSKQRRYLAP